METTMKQIRSLFLLLCLITAGAQSAWAQFYYTQQETVTINNQTYELSSFLSSYYAYLVDISGSNEEVVIPSSIENGGISYSVVGVGALIENNSMKSLTFKGYINFYYPIVNWLPIGASDPVYHVYSGFIKSTSLQTIEFQGNISNWNKNEARLLCPNLRHVVFTGDAPTFSGSWSNYCTAPASNVTAVVTSWSQETCEQKQLTATVWCEFKNVVPSLDLVHDATLKSNGGDVVQIWKNKNNKSQLDYTMSSEGGEELVTFYGNVDSYQIRIYTSSNYNNPVLKRNGTEVDLERGSGYYYYEETSHMSVNSYEVVYNANNSRRLNFVNFGNGTVTLSGVSNGSAVSYEAEGLTETTYTFDKTTPVSVTITPQEGYKVQRIEHYGRIAKSFDVNETTGVATTQYIFDDNESEQALKIYYQKKVVDDETQFKVRVSVEGSVGIGAVRWIDEDNPDWLDERIDDNEFSSEIAPGESEEVIGIYYSAENPILEFRVVNSLDEEDAAAGFTNTVKVYANGVKVECYEHHEDFGDYYSIPLDGGDMDVRVVFESNGRYLTGDNGNGGSVAIYCEGSDTPLRIEDPGYWFWTLIPKTAKPYVVITPLMGKTVVAVVRNGEVLSSLGNYRQSNGTYRIPLEGFDKGDAGYPLYVVYGDDISEVPVVEWNLLMVGDVDEVSSEGKKPYVMMYLDGDELLSTWQGEGSSVKTTCDIDKTWYLPASAYGSFSIYVIPGQTFQAFFKGTEVTDNFVRNEGYDQDGLLCYEYEIDGYEQFAVDGTWTYVFKKAEGFTWNAVATGASNYLFSVQYDGDPIIPNLDSENNVSSSSGQVTPEQVQDLSGIFVMAEPGYTFNVTFNGTNLNSVFDEGTLRTIDGKTYYEYQMTDAILDYKSLLSTDGIWLVEFKKAEGITWTAIAMGDMGNSVVDMEVNGGVYEVALPDGDDRIGKIEFDKAVFEDDYNRISIKLDPEYEFKAWFNGVELTGEFINEGAQSDGLIKYRFELYPATTEHAYLAVDGTWVFEFIKAEAEGITWDGMIIGDVPQGAVVDLGLDGMTMEVFLNAEEISASDTYTGPTDGIGMDAVLTVPAGYNFKIWFNGEEKTDKFDETGIYHINMENPTELAPYLQDGQWIVLFYDDLERYDLNGDKKVDIADVTKLVNVILGK